VLLGILKKHLKKGMLTLGKRGNCPCLFVCLMLTKGLKRVKVTFRILQRTLEIRLLNVGQQKVDFLETIKIV